MSTLRMPTVSSSRLLVKRPPGTKYKPVLCIDGGGVRGMIPTVVLQQLETQIKEHILENREKLIPEASLTSINSTHDFDVDLTDFFDLVAGTSVGSWLTAYIAGRGIGCDAIINDAALQKKYDYKLRAGAMETVRAVIREYGETIFPSENWFVKHIWRFFRPEYRSNGLKKVLHLVFGEAQLSQLVQGCLITSYDVQRNTACSFLRDFGDNANIYTVHTAARTAAMKPLSPSQIPDEGDIKTTGTSKGTPGNEWIADLDIQEGTDYYLRDIALASSSAPTYFPAAEISDLGPSKVGKLTLVDGGVVATNPTLQAITYAPEALSLDFIKSIAVFSVGCGVVYEKPSNNSDEGFLWWLKTGYLIDVLMKGSSEYIQAVVDFWLYNILKFEPNQYLRIQTTAPPSSPDAEILHSTDNAGNVPRLEVLGRELAERHKAEMRAFVDDFIFKT